MAQPDLRLRPWRRAEYERLVELGVFEGEPIELIAGQLVVAEPQSASHASAVGVAHEAFRAALPPGWIVRTQMPIALDDDSAPEPDLAIVPGTHADYRSAHPTEAALVVEVAVSSLALDRLHKGSAYARAGICDYWILNLTSPRRRGRCSGVTRSARSTPSIWRRVSPSAYRSARRSRSSRTTSRS